MNPDTSYAGGSSDQLHLRYKVGCEPLKIWPLHRLQYERQGTSVECLRRGYGLGESHTWANLPLESKDVEEEEIDLERLTRFPDRDLLAPETGIGLADDIRGVLIHVINGIEVLNSFEEWNPIVLMQLEIAQQNIAPTYFLGYRRADGEVRQYERLEESFSIEQTKSVLQGTELQKIFRVALHDGNLLIAFPGLGAHVDVTFELGNTSVCEVDFVSKTMVFYYIGEQRYPWYVRIMVQQFVLPGDNGWKLRFMTVRDFTALLFVLVHRMARKAVSDAMAALDIAYQKRVIVSYMQRQVAVRMAPLQQQAWNMYPLAMATQWLRTASGDHEPLVEVRASSLRDSLGQPFMRFDRRTPMLGVFAVKRIGMHTPFALYYGKLIPDPIVAEEEELLPKHLYYYTPAIPSKTIRLEDGKRVDWVIDGYPDTMADEDGIPVEAQVVSPAVYANDATLGEPHMLNNAELQSVLFAHVDLGDGPRNYVLAYLRALRVILPGEEIFVDYGPNYPGK